MALDPTVAGVSADSYVSLIEATSYFTARPGAASVAFLAESAPAQENALKVSAQMMECVRYFNDRFSVDQALQFPRSHHVSSVNIPFVDACIKQVQIIQAGALIASAIPSNIGIDSDTLGELRSIGVDSVSIGTTSLSFGGATSRDPRKTELIELGFDPKAATLLMRFISKVGSVIPDAEKLIRVGELRLHEAFV